MLHDYSDSYIEWGERFILGVPQIDNAHEEMVKVINRIHKMIRIGGNVKWTVSEAIKFLRAYSYRHFEEEEEFMRSIGYSYYEQHKHVHDKMRDKIVPRIYSQLKNSDFSQEAVEQFLRVCEKWLARHILGHDRDLVNWINDEGNKI